MNQSAFMLDLSQMASLFRVSTERSLCLIDEFGKGKSARLSARLTVELPDRFGEVGLNDGGHFFCE